MLKMSTFYCYVMYILYFITKIKHQLYFLSARSYTVAHIPPDSDSKEDVVMAPSHQLHSATTPSASESEQLD